MRLLTDSADRQMKFLVQFFHVQQHQVSHFHVLQLLPQFLDGVEVGGVRWQGTAVNIISFATPCVKYG